MTHYALKIISDTMNALGLRYGLGAYAGDPFAFPYFEGEYTETESFSEDGLQQSSFVLMGYGRTTWLELETAKKAILDHFGTYGKTYLNDDGSATVIMYANSSIIPVGDAEMKRIQINLQIKEWGVS